METRPLRIIFLSIYCFFLALLALSMMANTVFCNNLVSTDHVSASIGIICSVVLAAACVTVGIGLLYYSQLCWKILFFGLVAIGATMAAFLGVSLGLMLFKASLYAKYCARIHLTPVIWQSFLLLFASGFFVVYHLTREETLRYFGNLDHLIEPF